MAQHAPRCGYATRESRQEWFEAHGKPLPGGDERRELPADMLTANTDDPSAQLFHWQLYSLLGSDRIVALVRRFYERVFDDTDDPSFKQAFVQVAGLEHHVETQSAYWIDAMGGGRQYHGSGYRLKFHHENNAKQVMNAEGATRWMHHMTLTIEEFEPVFRAIDPRITPCIVDFLETKMKKYAKQFKWRFDKRDFSNAKTTANEDPAVAMGRMLASASETTSKAKNSSVAYGQSELEKMSVKVLKKICRELRLNPKRCVEKEDIIRLLGTTVQVVDDSEGGGGEGGRNPATTRWTMSTLRGMKPSALKQMAKCLNVSMVGCLEKKDMVDAIVASGKVDVDMGAGEEKEEQEGKEEERSGGRRK